jgi:hypothetical protein
MKIKTFPRKRTAKYSKDGSELSMVEKSGVAWRRVLLPHTMNKTLKAN